MGTLGIRSNVEPGGFMSQNNWATLVSEQFGEDDKSYWRRYVEWGLLIFDGSLSIRPQWRYSSKLFGTIAETHFKNNFCVSRPVTSLSDCRLKVLKDSFEWFQDWKKEIVQLIAAGVNTVKMLMSPKS